jgi:hypothetical protein
LGVGIFDHHLLLVIVHLAQEGQTAGDDFGAILGSKSSALLFWFWGPNDLLLPSGLTNPFGRNIFVKGNLRQRGNLPVMRSAASHLDRVAQFDDEILARRSGGFLAVGGAGAIECGM